VRVPYTAKELLELLIENKIDPTDFFAEADRLSKSELRILADLIREQINQRGKTP
jgi:hypothetical protein